MVSAITNESTQEREREEKIRFEILVTTYGKRSKLVQELSLRLAKMLFSMFGDGFELRVEEHSSSGKYPRRYSRVLYNSRASEGGTVKISRAVEESAQSRMSAPTHPVRAHGAW